MSDPNRCALNGIILCSGFTQLLFGDDLGRTKQALESTVAEMDRKFKRKGLFARLDAWLVTLLQSDVCSTAILNHTLSLNTGYCRRN